MTGSFSEQEYLEVQRFIYRVAEAVRRVLSPERAYILSLGSKAANSQVHWKTSPLPSCTPPERRQYYALMHDHGAIETRPAEVDEYGARVRQMLVKLAESLDQQRAEADADLQGLTGAGIVLAGQLLVLARSVSLVVAA